MEKTTNLLSLKSDWVFKRIFGKEGNEDILLDLLSAILNINIKRVELKNTELTKNKEEQKKSILDIKAILDDNSIIDIEMQVNNEYNMIDRTIQYLTKLYSEQLEIGEDYTKTKKVIIINILGYNLLKTNTYHTITHLKHEQHSKETYIELYDEEETTLTDKLEIHTIELPKFLKLKNIQDSQLVEWLRLISGKGELIKMALSKKAKKIEKAYKELEYLSQDKVARAEYDEYMEAKRLENMKIQYAEEKGIERGKCEGIAIGKSQGEKSKTIEIAKEMLKSKVQKVEIIKYTKLSEEELNKIEKEINE